MSRADAPDPDHIGFIADYAIIQLGESAKRAEKIAFRLPDTPERAELVWLIETMRDEEVKLRKRISELARKNLE